MGCTIVVKLQAVVRERYLDAVMDRLVLIGVRAVTIAAVSDSGGDAHRLAVFRGTVCVIPFAPRILLEWVGPDEQVDAVVRAIRQRSAPGSAIFLQRVDAIIHIRTGERRSSAT